MSRVVFIDMDDTICDFSSSFRRELKNNPGVKFPQSQYGFFLNLKPVKGAIIAVRALISSNDYDVYFLTAPSTRNPFSYTEKRVWIEKYFGYEATKRLIICSNKSLLKGHYLIDDNTEGNGQNYFGGSILQFGSDQCPDWNHVMKILKVDVEQGEENILSSILEDMQSLQQSVVIEKKDIEDFCRRIGYFWRGKS